MRLTVGLRPKRQIQETLSHLSFPKEKLEAFRQRSLLNRSTHSQMCLLDASIATPLVKALQSLSISIPREQSSHTFNKIGGKFNPISWTNDLVRIMHLETLSTYKHPSTVVQAGKNDLIVPTAAQFLLAGISRRRALASQDILPAHQMEQLLNDVDAMTKLVVAIDQGADPATSVWNTSMTWIVARKAMILGLGEPWMTATKST